MQVLTTTITDLQFKLGKSKRGPWTLATAVGANGDKFKTFDEKIQSQLKEFIASGNPVEIVFEATEKTWKDDKGEEVPYTDREIKELHVAKSTPSISSGPSDAKATQQGAAPSSKQDAQYWDNKQLLEFKRMSSMTALKACAEIMAACINSEIESYKFEDAMRIVKAEAKKLSAEYFAPLEGGAKDGSDQVADSEEQAEIVE